MVSSNTFSPERKTNQEPFRVRKFFAITAFLGLLTLYLWGSFEHAQKVNLNIQRTDQGAYLFYVKRFHTAMNSGLRTIVSGQTHVHVAKKDRMPLYPLLQALFYNPSYDDARAFLRSKYVNVFLSVILIGALFFIFKRHLDMGSTVNLTLISAFSVFMFKAAYIQCELLLYFLNFLGFLMMIQFLIMPNSKNGALVGFLMGLAFLTKSSALPGFILFLVFAFLKALQPTINDLCQKNSPLRDRRLSSRLRGIAYAIIVFILVGLPYFLPRIKSHKSFLMAEVLQAAPWCDSLGEFNASRKMRPEDRCSFNKYFRTHTATQIRDRVTKGSATVIKVCHNSYGYAKYVYLYLLIAAGAAGFLFITKKSIPGIFNNPLLLTFLITYFSVYFLLVAWYTPIVKGNRFILTLFLPAMFTLALFINNCFKKTALSVFGFTVTVLTAVNLLILIIFYVDLFTLLNRVGIMYAGF